METDVVGTHLKRLAEALQMITHNIPYENTPIQIYRKFTYKNRNFSDKKL